MYVKELKQFVSKSFNILFMLVAPIILILLMGYAMSNIIGTPVIENDKKVTLLYVIETTSNSTNLEKFSEFKKVIENEMDIPFKKVNSFEEGTKEVNQQNAIALIQVSSEGFYYYRSPYNEPTESKMLRTAFYTLLNTSEDFIPGSFIETKTVEVKSIDSYTYFTFAELGLIMMYLSLIVGQSVFAEKEAKTFRRIYTSKANIGNMLLSKIALGFTVGLVQIMLVYLLSTFVLKVNWGRLFFIIFGLYALFALFSSTLGAILGLYVKSKTSLNDRILMISIIFGFLGGGLTPISFLDSVKVMSLLCKLSPLYWVTNSAITLSGGIINKEFSIAIIVCLLTLVLLVLIHQHEKRKETTKGVYTYE
jgi:ABC-2 type transport system permease protein